MKSTAVSRPHRIGRVAVQGREASKASPGPGAAALPGAAAFLEGLVNGMRCGIVAVDSDERLVMINQVAQQILELELSPPSGAPVRSAFADHPSLAQVLCESFDMASLPNRAELELRLGESKRKTIGFTLSLITSDGDVRGVAMFFKDLTHIEHREEQERLRDRLAALGQMAASLAHEIRNPLAAIDVSCKLLERRLQAASPRDENGLGLLAKVTSEVRRLNKTITSSLEFVRPLALEVERGDLLGLLEEAIAVASERSGKPEIRVERRFPELVAPFLMDRQKLRQVFENLLINAMEAMGEAGRVAVLVELLAAPRGASVPYPTEPERDRDPWQTFEQFAVVRVVDSGPGIRPEDRDRVFYPFFTTKQHGSGVGLSMAKKIVDSHRGLIDLDDAPGGGALFTVRLPMVLENRRSDRT